jgi:tetratricopeptide (TPR) repeat protein
MVIIALALPFAVGKRKLMPYFFGALSPLLFLLAFHYGSFWFWRGHFAMHSLLSILCAALLAAIPAAGVRRALLILWGVALLPGFWHSWNDIRWFRTASAAVAPPRAEAMRWIYRNTKLQDRIVAWNTTEASLYPAVDYLRAGSRAGKTVYLGVTVVVGYTRNLELMSDLLRGIAANDYVLYGKDDPAFERILLACRAPVAFENASNAVYHVDKTCRANLSTPAVVEVKTEAVEARAQAEEQLRQRKVDPMDAVPADFGLWVAAHPGEAGAVARKRAELLWGEKKYGEAAALLQAAVEKAPAVAELEYSLGFTLQQMGKHGEAIGHFSRALELGYAEFWTRYARGSAYAAAGDKVRAVQDLKRASELDPAHPGPKTILETLRK